MRFKEYSFIQKVMVLGSAACNLNCDYCYLHEQHTGNAYALLNKEVQKAWKDGTYVNNIKKVFEAIECDPGTVDNLQIWGGEPLIILKNLIEPMYELTKFFKNCNSYIIPTNFARVENVTDLLHAVDRAVIENNIIKEFVFHLQLSIDAPPGPMHDAGHRVDWDIYKKNIDRLCREIKERPLKIVKLTFELHPTVSQDNMLKYLGTIEENKAYLKYYYDFHQYFLETIKKYDVGDMVIQHQNSVFPVTALPFKVSLEDSLNNYRNLYFLDYVEQELGFKYNAEGHIFTSNALNWTLGSVLYRNPVCTESGLMALTILPDGTITECPCDYVQTYKPYLEQTRNNPLKQSTYRDDLMKQKFFINPLTATDKEKEEFDWYIYDAIRLNNSTMIHLAMNLCLEMALSKQIDYTYFNNPEKLLKHLYQYYSMYACSREQIPLVKNAYLPDVYSCRRMLNGLSDLCIKAVTEDAKLEIKNTIKGKELNLSKISDEGD